jgi:hypothetical protein
MTLGTSYLADLELTREEQVPAMPEPALEAQKLGDDLQPLLDQELRRLPDSGKSALPASQLRPSDNGGQPLVSLASVEGDALGEVMPKSDPSRSSGM